MSSTVDAQDATHRTAKEHPIASVILDALHKQDARTYNANSGDIGRLALDTAATVESLVRADERRRLADVLEGDAETIAGFAGGKPELIQLVAYMLRLAPSGLPDA